MSLSWQWSDKMGECVYDNGYVGTLYRGNAFCICLAEDEKTYQLTWFFADKQHAKNCLGLNKDYDECFSNWGIRKLKLNNKYKETQEFIQLLAKAKVAIEIELYNEVGT